jgi:hypothetical protein
MAKIKIDNYTFDKTAKTVTFNNYVSIGLDHILIIVNVTDNIIIYNFADPTKGGTVSTNVLTLTYDTSSMSNTDNLLIYYDDGSNLATADNQSKIIKDGLNVNVGNISGQPPMIYGDGVQAVTLTNTEGEPVSIQNGVLDVSVKNIVNTISIPQDFSNLAVNKALGYLLPITDCTNYNTAYLQIFGTWAGTLTFQGSNDMGTWISVNGMSLTTGTSFGLPVTSTTVNGQFEIPIRFKFLRVTMTAYTSGNAQGFVRLVNSATSDTTSASIFLNNAGTMEQLKRLTAADNTVGTGIQSVGVIKQYDEIAPTQMTENYFGTPRMSKKRVQYSQIKGKDVLGTNNEMWENIADVNMKSELTTVDNFQNLMLEDIRQELKEIKELLFEFISSL